MASAMTFADPILDTEDCAIADLSDDERAMLREMAQRLRERHTRSVVARESLDHVAFLLNRAAERDSPV
jgi:hypothetical protein